MQNIIRHRTEQDIPDLAGALATPDNQQLELLFVGHLADSLTRRAELQAAGHFETGSRHGTAMIIENLLPGPPGTVANHFNLKIRDHPISQLIDIDNVQQGHALWEGDSVGNQALHSLLRGLRTVNRNNCTAIFNKGLLFSDDRVGLSAVTVNQLRQKQDQVGPVGQ